MPKPKVSKAKKVVKPLNVNVPSYKQKLQFDTDFKKSEEREKIKPKETKYTTLEIMSPGNDSTVHHGSGDLSVIVNLEPELKDNDTMILYVDGEQRLSGRSSEFFLSNIDRGSHAIDVAVINENDEVLIRSDKVVVHLRRMSRLFPNFPKDAPSEAVN